MKVDRTKLKKTPTEAPADCRALIEKLKACGDEQLLAELQQIKTWNIGKCELYHWVDLLDRFDGILADAGRTVENMSWLLACDRPEREQLKALLLAVLNFTALLIEYSFSRHLYSSIEHLTTLLASSDMQVVLAVLNLLYVFSKRSNYITRLGSDKRTPLLSRLQHLAEVTPACPQGVPWVSPCPLGVPVPPSQFLSRFFPPFQSWGGKENGFGLAECCRDLHMMVSFVSPNRVPKPPVGVPTHGPDPILFLLFPFLLFLLSLVVFWGASTQFCHFFWCPGDS
uniref:DUF908 domain-containing protein n=1 Tax=Anas platyrhynchos platyrhynchos TaxID=8840 RepID=A0A493TGV0_ANAPP